MSAILIDYPADHICRILINRPEKLNALNFEIREGMIKALPDILDNPQNRVLIFGGVGGNLSAGGDVPSMKQLTSLQARERMLHIHKLCRLVGNANIPVVTAAEGICAGGAVGLSLLGDYIIVGQSTKIMVPFLKLGLVPDWGMMRSLPLRIGLPKTRRLIFEAQTVKGRESVNMGLADFFVDDDNIMDRAVQLATDFTALPQQAIAMVKSRLRNHASFEDDLVLEVIDQVKGLTGEEFSEGFNAYIEKRHANFIDVK